MTLEPAVVAVDVGGTTIKGALVGTGARPLARLDVPTPAAGGAAVLGAVLRLAADLAAGGPALAVAAVAGVAAVTAGQVEDGVVRYAANLGWRDVPLAAELARALGVPAVADNDVWAAALAESVHGERGADCLFVALGTGVGSGHVVAGSVHSGVRGGAGEIGHIPVYPDGEPCSCGQRGCLEVYASAAGVARRYRAASTVDGHADGIGGDGAAGVVARLGRDPVADRVWAEAVEALALALATATLLLDPGVVVLGGGLAGAGDALLDPLRSRLAARLAWRPAPPLARSVLGTDAGWRGAALRAWQAAAPAPPAPGPPAAVGISAVPTARAGTSP